jgi:hypothetical protein
MKKYKRLTTKQRCLINNALHIKGTFNDSYWLAKNTIVDNMQAVCNDLDLDLTFDNSKYEKDENGIPARKIWYFTITDYNEHRQGFGQIIAAFCGSVSQLMDRYDIVAYVI